MTLTKAVELYLSKNDNRRRILNYYECYYIFLHCFYICTDHCDTLPRLIMKEVLLDPVDMTEELMFHIFNNDMNRSLDSKWLDLYVQLQHYLDFQKNIEREADE
jgi:hypothetical protein